MDSLPLHQDLSPQKKEVELKPTPRPRAQPRPKAKKAAVKAKTPLPTPRRPKRAMPERVKTEPQGYRLPESLKPKEVGAPKPEEGLFGPDDL